MVAHDLIQKSIIDFAPKVRPPCKFKVGLSAANTTKIWKHRHKDGRALWITVTCVNSYSRFKTHGYEDQVDDQVHPHVVSRLTWWNNMFLDSSHGGKIGSWPPQCTGPNNSDIPPPKSPKKKKTISLSENGLPQRKYYSEHHKACYINTIHINT